MAEDEGQGAGGNSNAPSGPAPIVPDAAMAAQLEPMGFSANAIARALVAVQNSSPDTAAAWLFEHMEDPNINDPLPDPSAGGGGAKSGPDPEQVGNLAAMLGFTEEQVRKRGGGEGPHKAKSNTIGGVGERHGIRALHAYICRWYADI